ncbi:MAG: DNA-directed DNA polymerase [Candidatus Hadarchaeota archaeon]
MKGVLLDVDYSEEEEQPAVRLFFKGEEAWAALDEKFEQFFFVEAEDSRKAQKIISKLEPTEQGRTVRPKSTEVVKRFRLGRELDVVKVSLRHPADVHTLRHAIRNEVPGVKDIYEHDIPPARRYLMFSGLTPMGGVEASGREEPRGGLKTIFLDSAPVPAQVSEPKLNVMSFDIEVYNPAGSPRPGKDPIIMMSLADNKGFRRVITWKGAKAGAEYLEVVKSEREMLERFIQIVQERDVDILMGYNTDLFDFPYIKERARQLKLKLTLGRDGSEVVSKRRRFATATRIRGRVHADVFSMVNFLASIGNIRLIHYTLEDVYLHMLGKKKPDFEFTKFVDAWEKGGALWKELVEYSMSDADATLELGLELLPLFIELTKLVGQSLFDVSRMTSGQLVEWLLMAEAHKRGELIPARPVAEDLEERSEETFVGAYVMEPVRGYHENIVVFDFRSLYPSIIVTHNIDPSTVNCNCCKKSDVIVVPELGYHICKNKKGFLPGIVEKVVKARAELKTELKNLKKGTREYESLNARQWALKIVSNSFYGMLAYPRARWYSKEAAESVTSFGRNYIYKTIEMARNAGLEVIYGDTDSLFNKLGDKSKKDVVDILKQINESLRGIIELELEGFYKRGVFVTKKRYAMIGEDGRMVVKGLEFVRRDWAALAKRTQEAVLEAILRDGSKEKAARIVKEVTKKVLEGKVDLDDLIIYTQLKMPIESYRAIGPHVAAAKKLKAKGVSIEPGMMIAYVEAKGAGSISDRAIPVDEFKGMKYDADYYVDNQILPAVMRIMEVLGYNESDLKFERHKQTGLEKFIK